MTTHDTPFQPNKDKTTTPPKKGNYTKIPMNLYLARITNMNGSFEYRLVKADTAIKAFKKTAKVYSNVDIVISHIIE